MKKILLTAGVFVSTFASVFAQKAPIVLYKDGANALQLNYSTFSNFAEDSTNTPFEGKKQYQFDYVSKNWWGGNVEFKFANDLQDFSGYTYLEVAWKAVGGTHPDVLNVYMIDSASTTKVTGPSVKVGVVGDEVGSYFVSKIPLTTLKGTGNLNLAFIKFIGFNINGGDSTATGSYFVDNIQLVEEPSFVVDDSKVIYKGNTNKLNMFYQSKEVAEPGKGSGSVRTGGPTFEGAKHYELNLTSSNYWGGNGLFNINGWGGDKQDYTGYNYLALAIKGTTLPSAMLKLKFVDNADVEGKTFVVANLTSESSNYGDLLYFPLADSVKGSTALDLSNIKNISFEVQYGAATGTGSIYLDNIIITKQKLAVGVNDVEYFSNLSVSPNPSNGIFNISSDRSINSLVVTDYMGTVINAPLINGNSIDLSNQKAGMYLVRISSGDQKITKKLIKE